jgi:hypothetical protein
MILKHAGQPEVVALAGIPLQSEERKRHLREFLNDENYLHNVEAIQHNTGEIIPFKMPSSASFSDTYIPCEYCCAMFAKSTLWKLKTKCPFKPDDVKLGGNHSCQGRGSLLLPFSKEASEGVKRDIMNVMNQNKVAAAVRTDDLIMKFDSRLHFKHGHLQHRWQYIRERIRQMGRLLLEVQKNTPSVKCLSDCPNPEMFVHVVKAVRSICGFDENSHGYRIPSLALKMGHS